MVEAINCTVLVFQPLLEVWFCFFASYNYTNIIIIIIMCSFLCHFSFGAQGPLNEIK